MLPRLRFAHLPTPIEPLERLSDALDGPRLWIKRDDQTGLALGGNKTRKLEFLLAAAQAQGARILITGGAAQSNHCRQTAAAAARFGFQCILVLTDAGLPSKLPSDFEILNQRVAEAENLKNLTGNRLLDHLFGAKILWAPAKDRDRVMRYAFDIAWEEGMRPYIIPYGGSNEIGAVAYVFALEELLDQCTGTPSLGSPPDWIVFPTSSGGTHAGLVVGGKLHDYPGKILGVCIDENAETMRQRVAELAGAVANVLAVSMQVAPGEILANDQYLGGGYGVMSEAEREAIYRFARKEGILLDPVYTGRAAAGLIDMIRKGFFKKEEIVLFWHTGGTPGLFADQYRELLSV